MLLQRLIDELGHSSFRETHQWSIDHPAEFWQRAWGELGIVGDPGTSPSAVEGFQDTQWFPGALLNVVDTLLAGDPDEEVMVALDEEGTRRSYTRGQLRQEVAACAAALVQAGVAPGDRVAAWMPHVPETVIFALGALCVGAVVSTASTDFGPAALVDRFGQIEPVVLLATASSR